MQEEGEKKKGEEGKEELEVRCFLGKQKSHIEMSLKSSRNLHRSRPLKPSLRVDKPP